MLFEEKYPLMGSSGSLRCITDKQVHKEFWVLCGLDVDVCGSC